MITSAKTIDISLGDIVLPEKTIFFDIETTGFSPTSTHLYMIGCCLFENEGWQLIQWFDETGTPEGEKLLLSAFHEKTAVCQNCISFNGRTFDFPYIQKKSAVHGLLDPLSHLRHIDLYRELKPYKALFGLKSFRQKSVEAFLGLRRADTYSGGELIPVYEAYVRDKEASKFDSLMLHNFEDVKGMFDLLPMLSYLAFFDGAYEIKEMQRCGTDFLFTAALKHFIKIPVFAACGHFDFTLSAYTAQIRVHGFDGELKYFYENYKDYEYLPLEDEAIHKSMAVFVDKQFRQKATRRNCYTKKADFFLPEYEVIFSPFFKQNYEDKTCWFMASQLLENPEKVIPYLNHLTASYEK